MAQGQAGSVRLSDSSLSKRQKADLILARTHHRQLKKPSLSTSTGPLYFASPPQLEAATSPNLAKLCTDVFAEGDEISVTDAALPFQMSLRVKFE